MADVTRVGIVGATVTTGGSGWGANAHVPALHALPDYELSAVCTSHEETARVSASKFGAALAFHDIEEMVQHHVRFEKRFSADGEGTPQIVNTFASMMQFVLS